MDNSENKLLRKTIDKFHRVAVKLQANFTEQNLDAVMDAFLDIHVYSTMLHSDLLKNTYNILPLSFYKRYAYEVISALNKDPLYWYTEIRPVLGSFSTSNFNYLSEQIRAHTSNSVASYIMQGELAIENNEMASGIVYMQQIEHYISYSYLAFYYYKMGNYANAIKALNLFYAELEKDIVENKKYDFKEDWVLRKMVLDDSLFLTYLYVMEKEYKQAISRFESMLELYSVEFLLNVFGSEDEDI